MNIQLIAVNAKYVHTNLAVRCLEKAAAPVCNVQIKEYSINDNIFSDNTNYKGYLKVVSDAGECLQSEPCEFSNADFRLVNSTFYVEYPMKVKIICGIKAGSTDYTLTGADRVYFDNIQITNDVINNLHNIMKLVSTQLRCFQDK